MNGLVLKPGVVLGHPTKAGFRMLSALDCTARHMGRDIMITCAREAHKPTDPHTLGKAYDIRTHDIEMDAKTDLVWALMGELSEGSEDEPKAVGRGVATRLFYGELEDLAGVNEHIHVQLRKGRTYA